MSNNEIVKKHIQFCFGMNEYYVHNSNNDSPAEWQGREKIIVVRPNAVSSDKLRDKESGIHHMSRQNSNYFCWITMTSLGNFPSNWNMISYGITMSVGWTINTGFANTTPSSTTLVTQNMYASLLFSCSVTSKANVTVSLTYEVSYYASTARSSTLNNWLTFSYTCWTSYIFSSSYLMICI